MIASAPMTFRGRLWRFTKRLTLAATLLTVAAAPVVYFGVPALAQHRKVRGRVEKALTRALGAPVQIGAMSFCWKDGLFLRDVAATDNSFRIDAVELKPRLSKLFSGKVRFRATLENPEFVVVDPGSEPREIRLPKFGKKGLRIDRVVIRNGTYVLKKGLDDGTVRFDGINAEGTGRLQNRSLRLDLTSLTATCDEVKVAAKGFLRLSKEGFGGELDLNDDAAKKPLLRDALRAARITLKQAPALSEPF